MNILFIITFFSILTLLIGVIFKINKENKELKYDISKLILATKRVRYGDINIKLEKLNNEELQNTINRLFETIHDRELMIKEYQATLSKKNLSLEEIIKQEKELRKLKEDITATLTHDMKVPVIAELNSIDYLLQGHFGELTEKQKEALNLMKTSNQELKELIENILEAYKMEQKKIELNISSIKINDFIEKIVKEMEPISIKKNINIVLELNETINCNINIDDFQIKRIIKNLLQNAITHSSKNTEISIETNKEQNEVKIKITNKGATISEEEIKLIFNKYYSGQSKFRKLGTGLGLYLSKKIAEAHNGDLAVFCDNENTTFTLSLPY